jgi:hypothetical protein
MQRFGRALSAREADQKIVISTAWLAERRRPMPSGSTTTHCA